MPDRDVLDGSRRRLAAIIPTLNEAALLPGLLESLAAQTRPPDEVVVADAGSTDGTQEAARRLGARVVPGGRPGAGRNAGARVTTADLLLFLDADVAPPPDFVESLLAAFDRSRADVATCLMAPRSRRLADRIGIDMANLYLWIVQPFSPHAPGFCILSRREAHDSIGGFDESVHLGEDHDYAQRAARSHRFAVLFDVRLPVSTRRVEREGLTALALKYLWCEAHALSGKPVRSAPFQYQMGSWQATERRRRTIVDVGELREQLGRFGDPLQQFSVEANRRLDRAIDQERGGVDQMIRALEEADQRALLRYLRRRRAVARAARRQAVSRLEALQSSGRGEWMEVISSRVRGARQPEEGAVAAGDPRDGR